MDEVTIICPYCEHPIQRVPLPADKAGSEPEEVVGLPYTRDVGRFDPKSEDDWFDVGGWSRIGKDYLKAIAWERIGILRVTRPGIDIRYRVQGLAAGVAGADPDRRSVAVHRRLTVQRLDLRALAP